MMKNNLKITWRNLVNQKIFSAIKIGGLALGIATCLLISLYIKHELSYEEHIPGSDRIFRIIGVNFQNEDVNRSVYFPAPLASILKKDYPEIEMAGRINASELFGAGSIEFRPVDDIQNNYEEGMAYFDQELLDIFKIPFVYGNANTALSEANSVVISKSKADKYFPNENPVGKSVILNSETSYPFKIGGVMEDFPENSHIHFDFLVSMKDREFWSGEQTFWMANNYHTYIKVRSDCDPNQLEEKLFGIVENYYLPALRQSNYTNAEDVLKQLDIEIQPVTDIHLKSENIWDQFVHGNIRIVRIFGIIAMFILVLACINFINLSTAKAAGRAKEVGLRKTIGSMRKNLISQFLTESVLFSVLSFGIGIILATLLLPFFNHLADKNIAMPWNEWWFVPVLAIASLIVGILAGLYPSFYLSSFKPISVLQGNLRQGTKNTKMRNTLVIFQFTTSIILIIGTLTVHQQMKFILNKNLGYEKDHVMVVQGTGSMGEKIQSFKNELLALSGIENVTVSDYLPISGTKRNGNAFWKEGRREIDQPEFSEIWIVDHDYVKTLGMEIIEGRDFSKERADDNNGLIINESFQRMLNFENPIGQHVLNHGKTWNIIGVIKDIHFENLKMETRSLCLQLGNSPSMVSIKTSTASMGKLINEVKKTWDTFLPNQPFRYTFIDTRFAMMHDEVQKTKRLFTSFAILAIVVACLGLFGLISYTALQRKKEIGVRKVNGARVTEIIALLNADMIKSVMIAFILASALGWYAMNSWLENYAYRINISWWIFGLAGLFAFSIAFLTVSWQSWRAAVKNPVESLRYE